MRIRLLDGTFGCSLLLGALLLTAVLFGCSTGHLQVFGTGDEEAFSAWVPTMKGADEKETLRNYTVWAKNSMSYEPGVYVPGSSPIRPTYLDAFNQETNCYGYAAVAIEMLKRNGYHDAVILQTDWRGDDWHTVCTNKWFASSNDVFWDFGQELTYDEIANYTDPSWKKYHVYDADGNEVGHGERP